VLKDVDREGQARQVGTLDPGPVAQRIEQQPSKLKVAGSIPAGVANERAHKSRYFKIFRQGIECRAEQPIRDKTEQNGSNAHESGAKAHEKSHDFSDLFSRVEASCGTPTRANDMEGERVACPFCRR
jgi:hypothetical protein